MYKVLRIGGITFGLVWAFLCGLPQAQAQQGGYLLPNQRPAVSQWNNLLRSGSDPAINLYGIVQPNVYFRNNINLLGQDQQNLANQQQNLAAYTGVPPTGTAQGGARFMTQNRYFMTNGRAGTGGGGGGKGGGGGMGGGMGR